MANFKQQSAFARLRRLAKRLEGADIPYAVVGDFALYAHGALPAQDSVEILVNGTGLDGFSRRFVPGAYLQVSGNARKFIESASGQPISLRLAGHRPGIEERTPVTYPEPSDSREMIDGIFYLAYPTLIELKLATQNFRDTADAIKLIHARDLNASFLHRLHPFVHKAFDACLDEICREEEFLARNG